MIQTRTGIVSAALGLALMVGCASNKASEPAVEAELAPIAAPEPMAEMAPTTAELGQVAPNFSLTDTEGNTVSLADFRGKRVVLEWFNPGCPFVKYAHAEGGPLVDLPKRYLDQGVVWLAINSGGEGKEGAGEGNNQKAREAWGMTYPVLMDPTGRVGKLYQARTTPHLYVIDEAGVLVYQGALDNAPRGELQGGDGPVNYIDMAFADLGNGAKVSSAQTKPYGCGVKYAD